MGDRPPGEAPLYLKVAAGLTTGAVAIAIASPTDLVKVNGSFVAVFWHVGPSLYLHNTQAYCMNGALKSSPFYDAAPAVRPHAWQASDVLWCFSAASITL